jgi:cytochrome c2
MFLSACAGSTAAETAKEPAPTLSATAQLGKKVFEQNCGACHSLIADDTIVGPSLHGIASRAATQVAGQDAERYLYASILKPEEFLVEGYDNLMPSSLGKQLSGEELDAVVAYLLTQR